MEEMNNNEIMETTVDETTDTEMDTYEESGSGKSVAIVLAGLAALGAAGALAYRRIKDKKNGKPRKRKKLMWVEVEDDEAVADADASVVEEETTEE